MDSITNKGKLIAFERFISIYAIRYMSLDLKQMYNVSHNQHPRKIAFLYALKSCKFRLLVCSLKHNYPNCFLLVSLDITRKQ